MHEVKLSRECSGSYRSRLLVTKGRGPRGKSQGWNDGLGNCMSVLALLTSFGSEEGRDTTEVLTGAIWL